MLGIGGATTGAGLRQARGQKGSATSALRTSNPPKMCRPSAVAGLTPALMAPLRCRRVLRDRGRHEFSIDPPNRAISFTSLEAIGCNDTSAIKNTVSICRSAAGSSGHLKLTQSRHGP
jgi:hypothetical protein